MANSRSDLHFYFDPVCPFAWMTNKWVRMVAEQREYRVDWRFISLRILNAHIDYAAHFPPEYEAGHTAGLRLLRVAARTRAEHGPAAVGSLYAAIGTRLFDTSSRCCATPGYPPNWPTRSTTHRSTMSSARRRRRRSP